MHVLEFIVQSSVSAYTTPWNKTAPLQGEKVSSDVSAVEPFKDELQELLEREHLTLDQLYNCDHTQLCYIMLPSKTEYPF